MSNGNATVSVGCKLPSGLVLEMGQPGSEDYKRVVIIGSRGRNKGHGNLPGCLVTHGCGITFGVPKDFIEAWLAKHKALDMVRNGLVFAMSRPDAEAHAKAIEGLQSGFEQILPPQGSGLTAVPKDE